MTWSMAQIHTQSVITYSISESKESRELRVNTMSLSLSGVEQTYISLFLGKARQQADPDSEGRYQPAGAIVGSPCGIRWPTDSI